MWRTALIVPTLWAVFIAGLVFSHRAPPALRAWSDQASAKLCAQVPSGVRPWLCFEDPEVLPAPHGRDCLPVDASVPQRNEEERCVVGTCVPADMGHLSRQHLYAWLKRGGGEIGTVEESMIPGMGTRGVLATANVTAGDTVFRVPYSLWITETTAWGTSTGQALRRVNMTRDSVHGSAAIATQLLVERANPWSFWAPYLATLPEPMSVLFFDEDDRAAVQSSVARGSLDQTQEHAAWFYRHVITPALRESPHILPRHLVSEFEWKRVLSWAQARCFLVPRADGSQFEWGMVPVADLVNHETLAPNNYMTDAGAFVMLAARDVAAGGQVTITYGPKSNTQLMVNYGFVEEGNPLDRVMLRLRTGLAPGRVEARLGEFERQAAARLVGLEGGLPRSCLAGDAPDNGSGGGGGLQCSAEEAVRVELQREAALSLLARGVTEGREAAVAPLGGPHFRDARGDVVWKAAPAEMRAQLMRPGRARATGKASRFPEEVDPAAVEGGGRSDGGDGGEEAEDMEILAMVYSSGCVDPAALQAVAVMQLLDMEGAAELMLHFLLGYLHTLPTSLAEDEAVLTGGESLETPPTRLLAVRFRMELKRLLYRAVKFLDTLLVAEGARPLTRRLDGAMRRQFHAAAGSALMLWSAETSDWWGRGGKFGKQWRVQCGCARLPDCTRQVLADSLLLDAALEAREVALANNETAPEAAEDVKVPVEERLRQGRPLSVLLEAPDKIEVVHWSTNVDQAEVLEEIKVDLPLAL